MTTTVATPCNDPAEHRLFMPASEKISTLDRHQSRAVRAAWDMAIRHCNQCPRRQPCLDDELAVMRRGAVTVGVVGATTPQQRREMLT